MNKQAVAKKIAEESMVLLKNEENVLPLDLNTTTAVFGRAQIDMIYSGNGSGAAYVEGKKNILEALEEAGINTVKSLKSFYLKSIEEDRKEPKDTIDWSKLEKTSNCGWMYEIFGKYHAPEKEFSVPEKLLQDAGRQTKTAMIVLGRNAGGEECDRHLQEDYYLTESEQQLIDQVCENFSTVILILNINGLIDLSWTEKKQIKGILFIGIPGEEGAGALADLIVGKANPSGKLPFTIARKYQDYPTWKDFSWNKDDPELLLTYESYGLNAAENGSVKYEKSPVTVYRENIYLGYRYFDSFQVEPLFPFGYGLSYTEFSVRLENIYTSNENISLEVAVKNTGTRMGKEVVQVYVSKCKCESEQVYQELKGFEKTEIIQPEEETRIYIKIPWEEMATYVEEKASYIIEKGTYFLRVGTSSKKTEPMVEIELKEDILTEKCSNKLMPQPCNQGKVPFIVAKQKEQTCICKYKINLEKVVGKSRDKRSHKKDKIVTELTMEQLMALCVGYGPGIPFSAYAKKHDPETITDSNGNPVTVNSHPTGVNGYVSPAIPEKDIYSVFYKDGPAGIGEISWPTEMLLSCSFDRKLWYLFGNAVGEECEKQKVDVWLAPAVNLQRNPLGGRNFEYFSEDPFLTGICACEISKGVQENHRVLVCPKHFAVNEQETYRRGNAKKNYDAVDSIITERAARELYLKPFKMLVQEADIVCLMTAFNKINGIFSGGNKDLCTDILRKEWGFQGVVVTDWGDMDIVVDGADAIAAGNDIIMPGGPPVIQQIRKGYEEKRITKEMLECAVQNLLFMLQKRNKDET
ncbi:MAG: glycoside hydrolase family 3 protein [Lachnospiraceae bacterium]|nr:glycoside hydrolase family 3 protein [Lachnospiraceae bacterium]